MQGTSGGEKEQSLGFAAIWLIAILITCDFALAQTKSSKVASQAQERPEAKSFHSPNDAAAALYAAARRDDESDLLVILGPGAQELISWSDDPSERKAQREHFAQKYDQMHRLVKEPDDTVALYVGTENWPLPIPLVEYHGAWYFDTDLGKQEVLYRRIGRNEVEAVEVCHALVDAEKEYYAVAHHYTERFISHDDSNDGLYWKEIDGKQQSPIGPYLARAGVSESDRGGHVPFHGYYYRILLQGTGPGAAANAVPQSKTDAFAVLAFPAEYHSSGVMSFLMDERGEVYEKDLGEMTNPLSKPAASYKPDSSWRKVE